MLNLNGLSYSSLPPSDDEVACLRSAFDVAFILEIRKTEIYLKSIKSSTTEEVESAQISHRITLINTSFKPSTIEVEEEYASRVKKAHEQGNLYLVDSDPAGQVRTSRLKAKSLKVIGLSKSDYHAKVDSIVRRLLRQRTPLKVEKPKKRKDNPWYENARASNRTRALTEGKSQHETVVSNPQNITKLIDERSFEEKSRMEEKAKRIDAFRRNMVKNQVKSIESRDERREIADKENEINKSFGIPPNPPKIFCIQSGNNSLKGTAG